MSTYSNRLQSAFQNLLRVVRFFHQRLSCTMHISADAVVGRKSLIKPVTWQKTCNYRVVQFFHRRSSCRTTYISIGRCSENNNIKCVVNDDLGWKNQTTRYILPHHWLYEWFSQFHSCGTYSVLSRSLSIFSSLCLPFHSCLWWKCVTKLAAFCYMALLKTCYTTCPIPFRSEVNSSQTSG